MHQLNIKSYMGYRYFLKTEIHRFKNIGYNHQLWTNWPTDNSKCDEIKFPILNKCTEYWDKLVE
jgi:hypothetical protein